MKRLKNISTGIFVFVGMSTTGLVVGGIVRGMMGAESYAVIGVIWAAITVAGVFRLIAFATSNQDMP
jgi:hypothetical protein